MIIVAVTAPVKPEQREAMMEATIAVQNATRQEPGCITYTFHTQVEAPDTFFVFEVWESQEALDAHMKQEHTQSFLAFAGQALSGPMTAKRYEASGEGALGL